MSKPRIAVAGANGAFGTKHLEALAEIEDAEVTAVMATSMEKANGIADKFNVPLRFDDYQSLIDCDQVDGVILATPTQLHAAQAIAAMDAGKHVMIEIPMADSLADLKSWLQNRLKQGAWRWQGMCVDSTPLINGCIIKSGQASYLSSSLMSRPIFSGAQI